jgi:hypothetical protein
MAAKKKNTAKRAAKKTSRKRNASVVLTPDQVSTVQTLMGGVPIPTSFLNKVGREYSRVANPSAAAFRKCVNAVAGAKRKTKKRARPVRKRATAVRAMVAAHKKKNPGRRNPIDTAAEKYEQFHGRAPGEVIEVETKLREHSVLSGIGKLEWLKIRTVDNRHEVTLKGFREALLAQDEKGRQLYIVGGDQSVSLKDFGIDPAVAHESEVLGVCKEIAYQTRKDHLGEAGGAGRRVTHVHDFGSKREIDADDPRRKKGSRPPTVIYDVRNRLLSFSGGNYDIPEVGIRG